MFIFSIPHYECFILPVIGCLHAWFLSAGTTLSVTDIECGHITPDTFNTVQLLWAETANIGCAFGVQLNGDIRVVCNFSPGAPFRIRAKYYCGVIKHKHLTNFFEKGTNVTNLKFLSSIGLKLKEIRNVKNDKYLISERIESKEKNLTRRSRSSELDIFNKIYSPGWIRGTMNANKNGTAGMTIRLVTRFTFTDDGDSKCDTEVPIYITGETASLCEEKGLRFKGLCYEYGDVTSGFRLFAILAPIALFVLILYDLFSGVVRQNNT